MRSDPDHDCSEWPNEYYVNDSGWDTSYCPEIPTHDIDKCETVQGTELFKLHDGTVLMYNAETSERVMILTPAESDAVKTLLINKRP
jgi:hypothetical protein